MLPLGIYIHFSMVSIIKDQHLYCCPSDNIKQKEILTFFYLNNDSCWDGYEAVETRRKGDPPKRTVCVSSVSCRFMAYHRVPIFRG